MRKPDPMKKARKEPSPTRDRILDMAGSLFNMHSFERVTTRAIAEATGINEGNLYYHFRTKEAVCLALFERFESDALSIVGRRPGCDEPLLPYIGMFGDWFTLTWSYRFLFRDIGALSMAAPALRRPHRRLSLSMRTDMQRVLDELRRNGMLRLTDVQRDVLLANVWIVSSYWMNYLALHQGMQRMRPAHLDWGRNQLRSLYEPYLTASARKLLEDLAATGVAPTVRSS